MSDTEQAFLSQLEAWAPNAALLLITKFVPMRPADLEMWMDDPEQWMNEEESELDEFQLRVRDCHSISISDILIYLVGLSSQPAALKLLGLIISQYRATAGPAIVGLLSSETVKRG